MLEIDIDVGRFIAFPADETAEQQGALRRIDLGDAEAVTHRRVGRRATALAQDALLAGKLDNVVDRQEISFVFEFMNQIQFVFQLFLHHRRNLIGEPVTRADISLLAQIAGRGISRRHNLIWVFIAQLIQREGA